MLFSVAPGERDAHTTHGKKTHTEKKVKKTQIGEIPLRFSGISLFGPGAQALAKSENLHLERVRIYTFKG